MNTILAAIALASAYTQAREFETTGEWRYSPVEGPNAGSTTLYSNSPTATATWRPSVRGSASYRLSSWAVARPGDAPVQFEIRSSNRTASVTLDPPAKAGWQVLGTYDLTGAASEWVRLRRSGSKGNLRAAAFRVERIDGGSATVVGTFDQLIPFDPGSLSSSSASYTGGTPSGQWKLTFSDDFDTLDTSKWKVFDNDTWGKILSGRFKDNVSVADGKLRLLTKRESKGGKEWTTGMVMSKSFRQKGGYFEARFRFAPVPGLNQAFWLKAVREPGAPLFEIDIIEGHYPNFVNMTLHDKAAAAKTHAPKQDLSADYHMYGLEWNARELIFYMDGQIVDRKPVDPDAPECAVFLSTAVANWAGPVTKHLNGSVMLVDWVKVYRRQ